MVRISLGFGVALSVGLVALLLLLQPRPIAESPSAQSARSDQPAGAEVELLHFEELHDPYGVELPRQVLEDIRTQIDRLGPPVLSRQLLEPAWEFIGPQAMLLHAGDFPEYQNANFNEYYGRVSDFEVVLSQNDERAAGALGGLFEKNPIFPPVTRAKPISDNVPTLAIGSFATHPNDRDIILLGTGYPAGRKAINGMGLWKTVDGGANWTQIMMGPQILAEPRAFYRLRYDRFDPSIVHAATTNGYWRSTDGGDTWAVIESGYASDFAQSQSDPNLMFLTKWASCGGCTGAGVFRSDQGGIAGSWVHMKVGIDSIGVGRSAIGISGSSHVYAVFSTAAGDTLMGVFRSDDTGLTWEKISPAPHWTLRQGWHNTSLGVHPSNPNIVVIGFVDLWRTDNATAPAASVTWTRINETQGVGTSRIHHDIKIIRWADDGSWVGAATDGGTYLSYDDGLTWKIYEWYPFTMFNHIDVDPTDPARVAGGSQDNGLSFTDEAGIQPLWLFRNPGDGGGVAFQNLFLNPLWATVGPDTGNIAWATRWSDDDGWHWTTRNDGIGLSNQWTTRIRAGKLGGAQAKLLTAVESNVYEWDSQGLQWTNLNPGSPFRNGLFELVEARGLSIVDGLGDAAWVATTATDGDRALYRSGGGAFVERSAGLPPGRVRKVSGDPYGSDPNTGYAIMDGLSDDIIGARLWRTTDQGQSWENITGNLPDVPVTDALQHPTDSSVLYVSSEFGVFKTENALNPAPTWTTWMDGLPLSVDVRELVPYYDTGSDQYYVYAATYGRSAYRRDLTGRTTTVPSTDFGTLGAVRPNPFRSTATISYRLGQGESGTVTIYDVRGRRVREFALGGADSAWRTLAWDGTDARNRPVIAGVYFVVLRAGEREHRRKVVLLR